MNRTQRKERLKQIHRKRKESHRAGSLHSSGNAAEPKNLAAAEALISDLAEEALPLGELAELAGQVRRFLMKTLAAAEPAHEAAEDCTEAEAAEPVSTREGLTACRLAIQLMRLMEKAQARTVAPQAPPLTA